MAGTETLRVVLLGKVGSGKSSLGNTIFGDGECFKVNHRASSNSKDLWIFFPKHVLGRNIQLTDTPGLFDPNCPTSNVDVLKRCAENEPHAFLLVLKVERFTQQEQTLIDEILEFFSEEVLKYTTVVFSHGDQLPDGMRIKEWVHHSEALKTLVQKCGGRVHVFDNKYWNNSQDPYRNNQIQVRELLRTMNQTVRENRGGGYKHTTSQGPMASGEGSSKSTYLQEESESLKIVILGKTGSGKSSLGNTIFGDRECFKVNHFPSSNSKDKWINFTRHVLGRNIQLTDTPGVFDPSSSTSSFDVLKRCTENEPHAFLLVLKVESFTRQEQTMIDDILEFSEEVLKYTTVVFSHGEQLQKGMRIEEWVHQREALKTLVQKCGGRVHVFDSKYWNNSQDLYRNNQNQVRELLRTIDQTVRENGGGGYKYTPSPGPRTKKLQEESESLMRIALLEKTGSETSSLGNTIFGDRCFKVQHGTPSNTKQYQSIVKRVDGRKIQLIDTLGLFDTDLSSFELRSELLKGVTECAPGPHAFLPVLKVERYTQQEQAVVHIILRYFSKEALKYTTVVFTHGVDLPDGTTIKELVHKNEALKTLMHKCGGRCHVFDNKYWNNSEDLYRNNQVQIENPFNTIEEPVKKRRKMLHQ